MKPHIKILSDIASAFGASSSHGQNAQNELPSASQETPQGAPPPFPSQDSSSASMQQSEVPVIPVEALPSAVLEDTKSLSNVCVRLWRVQRRLQNLHGSRQGASPEELEWLNRRFVEIMEALQDMGVEVLENTGEKYDAGLNLRVLDWETRADLSRETILETIKPTLRLRGLLLPGEVIVGRPEQESSSELEGSPEHKRETEAKSEPISEPVAVPEPAASPTDSHEKSAGESAEHVGDEQPIVADKEIDSKGGKDES